MSSILLVVASLIVFPFLTYYATSTVFFRRSNSTSTGKGPPTIPYFILGVFSTAGFAQLGARKYFAELIKDYGTFAPFRVRAGPRSYIVLRDPTHIRRVVEARDHFSARAAKVEAFDKLFGSPKAENHFHKTEVNAPEEVEPGAFSFHISDTTLASSVDTYISILSANMHDKMFQYDTWTRIEDLWSFLQLVILRCTTETLFGSALLKQYPRMVRDYVGFNTEAEGFVPGMPRIMLSGVSKACDRLYKGMETWVPSGRSELTDGEGFGEPTPDDSNWDEYTGLEFVRKHYSNCHNIVKSSQQMQRGTAAEVLSILHTTNSELLSSTFWTTVETLRKSHLTRKVAATVTQHFSPITHKYDVLGLVQDPFVKSLQTEVRRLRTANCVVRINETEGFPLDKQWSLPKGATVTLFSHDIALNTDIWKKVQPRALEKPLEEFWAERFTNPEQKSGYKKSADPETNESEAGDLGDLITKLTTCDQFPGSRFISALQIATLAVLSAEFEMQLSDTDEVDAFLPFAREMAFDTVKPREKIAVRIRKRRT